MGKQGKGWLGTAQFSAVVTSLEMKEGNPECIVGCGEEWVLLLHFQGQAVLFCLGMFFLRKSQSSHHINKYSSTLVTTAYEYETNTCKDARSHANGLKIFSENFTKIRPEQLNSGRKDWEQIL